MFGAEISRVQQMTPTNFEISQSIDLFQNNLSNS
jgi:hypothetical protein